MGHKLKVNNTHFASYNITLVSSCPC